MAGPQALLRIEDRQERGRVAYLTVDYAEKINVLNTSLLISLQERLDSLSKEDSLRAVVVTGAGDRAFIGGADINEMAGLDGPSARQFITRIHGVCAALRALPVPVVARIGGYCLGAGLEVAAACDLRIAADTAIFGMPEVLVGVPSVIEAALLPGLIGWGKTRRLLLTGESIDAEKALQWGFLEEVVPKKGLDEAVEACIGSILSAGPEAVRRQKSLMRAWETATLDEAIAAGIDAFEESFDTEEPARYMKAFLERQRKRKKGAS